MSNGSSAGFRRLFRLCVAGLIVFGLGHLTSPVVAAEDRFLSPLVITGTVEEGLYLYGQLNKGFLVYDDGQTTELYPLVDNANSSTRFGAWYRRQVAEDLNFSSNFEFEWNPYSTFRVNRLNRDDINWSNNRLRKAELIFKSREFGDLWLGQGSSASDNTAEVDLSGTTVVAYSLVADPAGGQLLALSGGGLSDLRIGRTFRNIDGLRRLVRARYDTPEFAGIRLRSSVGQDLVNEIDSLEWDIAATYGAKPGDYVVKAAFGYARALGNIDRLSGSASMLHEKTGLNFTLAAGAELVSPDNNSFAYGKVGWLTKLTESGPTAFSIDAYSGDNLGIDGSTSLSVGLAAVQSLSRYRTDLYAVVRWYDYDDPTADYETGLAFLTGARFKF